jgi:hypothetical protein
MRVLSPVLTAIVAVVASTTSGAAFIDDKTGLSVEPDAPFEAVRGPPRANYDVVVNVRSTTGKPVAAGSDGNLCGVAYKGAAQNADLDQDQINRLTVDPERVSMIKAPFERLGQVESTDIFEQAGLKGVELVIAPNAGPANETVRMYIAIWETPRGRTVVSCATKVEEMPQALDAFQAVRRSVRMPR